ncbi:Rrp15p-domain-containing protein [Hypoxylon argillaceum]|nr:Rrp15p-domain-containing protein [Hypoxylon argillaceum]KAI1147534.1 Rrp15p-domain-containing protein [Nemania diffusa]
MAGTSTKKRSHADSAAAGKFQRPKKKQRKFAQYHSDSEEDLDNALVDDVASLSDSEIGSEPDADTPASTSARRKKGPTTARKNAKNADEDESDSQEDGAGAESNDDIDDEEDEFTHSEDETSNIGSKRPKSKRNDPGAFATSLQKILSTKLSNSKKSDAILSRSVEAHKASREIVDATLEAKARKLLRDQKLLALEKGRVKDVLTGDVGEEISTGEIMQTERRLRKTAHRGVIMLFRAVREAQERAIEADRDARKEGIIGAHQRQEKVNEMSRQGFLDLIAGGGGGHTKKSGLEGA